MQVKLAVRSSTMKWYMETGTSINAKMQFSRINCLKIDRNFKKIP